MIFNLIVDVTVSIFSFLIGLFPGAENPDINWLLTIQQTIDNVHNFLAWTNFFFPVDLLFNLVKAAVFLFIVTMNIKFILIILHQYHRI